MHALTMHAYCGMAIPIEDGDRSDVRRAAAQQLRMARAEHRPVSVLTRGQEWEIEDRPDARMVSDASGILSLDNVGAECRECGQQVDDVDSRRLSLSARAYFTCADCNNPEPFADDDDEFADTVGDR